MKEAEENEDIHQSDQEEEELTDYMRRLEESRRNIREHLGTVVATESKKDGYTMYWEVIDNKSVHPVDRLRERSPNNIGIRNRRMRMELQTSQVPLGQLFLYLMFGDDTTILQEALQMVNHQVNVQNEKKGERWISIHKRDQKFFHGRISDRYSTSSRSSRLFPEREESIPAEILARRI